MATFSKDGTTASYVYNGEGQRTSKTVNGRKIEYVLDAGGTILAEKYDTFTVRYLFNETGTRIGFAFTTGTGSSIIGTGRKILYTQVVNHHQRIEQSFFLIQVLCALHLVRINLCPPMLSSSVGEL